MSKIYLLNYKNYYNRSAAKLNNKAAYNSYIIYSINDANFNPADGVDTSHVIGKADFIGNPDYMLVCSDADTIQSRWYILESDRSRNGQYRMTLRRDVIADYKTQLLTAPAMIYRAMAQIGNYAIYNSEGQTYNQIKTAEYLLKDETSTGWVVGYHSELNQAINVTIPNNSIVISDTIATMDDYPFKKQSDIYNINTSAPTAHTETINTDIVYAKPTIRVALIESAPGSTIFAGLNNGTVQSEQSVDSTTFQSLNSLSNVQLKPILAPGLQSIYNKIWQLARQTHLNQTKINDLKNEVGKIYIINNKYYRVQNINHEWSAETYENATGTIRTTIETVKPSEIIGTATTNSYGIKITYERAYLTLQEFAPNVSGFTIAQGIRPLTDSPYCMFCIPYGGYEVINGTTKYISKEMALDIANGIGRALGSNKFDIGILPYCPRRDFLMLPATSLFVGTNAGITFGTEHYDYELVKDSNNNTIAAVVWCSNSQFIFNITGSAAPSFSVPENNVDFKIENETKFIRLCSPNYNGIYEMTPTKNGNISNYTVYCKYKPFNPYIQIAPNFGNLYGQNFDDAKGLICSGDFSIAQISDAWINYELSNKNYQNSFNRQIQSQEFMNKISRKMEIVNAVTGTVGASVNGAMTGALAGPYGAIAGAVVGAVGGGITGGMDVKQNEAIRDEQLQLSKDMFNYNMSNVQALPDSLTKVAAQTPVNKIFPFIEVYESTEGERAKLRLKIEYRSMSINNIGTIQEYQTESPQYMAGRFIKIEGFTDDTHLLQAINAEFEGGIYI